jgi:YD repeat-containing protein
MRNNRFITTAFVLLLCVVASAQASKQEQIKKIRQTYAEAKAQIAQNGKNGMAPLDLTITVNDGTQVDEDFIINEQRTLTFYFNKHRVNSELDYPDASHCYFIIEKWEANGHSSYREILFDPNEGTLLFSFTKSETHAGYVTETRYYYDGQGNVIEQKRKAGGDEVKPGSVLWEENGGDQALAADLLDIFDWVMNPGHEVGEGSFPIEKTAPKAERLKTIRSAYTAAKDKVAKNDKADIQRDVQIVIRDQSWGPPETRTVNYYYDIFEDYPEPDGASIDKFCYLISERLHHNGMGPDIYNEYLLTPQGHHLLFSYTNAKEEGEQTEWRYYFDENGKCIETKTNSDTQDGGKADKERVRKLVMIFQKLTN